MTKIEWSDSLSIGVELLDEQHKMLIQKLNDLSKALENRQGEVGTVKALEFMVDYTDFHFSAEEKIMAEQNYHGLEHQKKQHAEFKGHLNQLIEDYREEGPTKELVTSVNVLLINWLIKHIHGVDLKLGEFLKS